MTLNFEGHMGLKSSPLATTSCKLTKKFLVLQHINAHNKKLSNVKSSVDTSCPKSWYKHVNVKDQIRRENSSHSNSRTRPLSGKSQYVSSQSMENIILEDKLQDLYQSPHSDRDMKEKPNEIVLDLENTDILDKNCGKFTHQKSFTPRILKNDKTPKLTQLKCYNPPKRKAKEIIPRNEYMMEDNTIIISENVQSLQQSIPETELSDDEVRLRELDFLQELTSDILLKHNFTDLEVEQTCEYHVKRNKFGLKVEQMRKLSLFVIENTKGFPRSFTSMHTPFLDQHDDSEEYYPIEFDIKKRLMPYEASATPSRFQQTSDDLESNHLSNTEDNILMLSKSNSLEFHNELELEHVRETFESVRVVERTDSEQETNEQIFYQSREDETTKNVHFATHNDMYSAQDDHSLTDVSPIQAESSLDSTNTNLSLDLNKTPAPFEDSYPPKMQDYDDDFDY